MLKDQRLRYGDTKNVRHIPRWERHIRGLAPAFHVSNAVVLACGRRELPSRTRGYSVKCQKTPTSLSYDIEGCRRSYTGDVDYLDTMISRRCRYLLLVVRDVTDRDSGKICYQQLYTTEVRGNVFWHRHLLLRGHWHVLDCRGTNYTYLSLLFDREHIIHHPPSCAQIIRRLTQIFQAIPLYGSGYHVITKQCIE